MRPTIQKETYDFLDKATRDRAANAIFSLAVIASVLCTAAWGTHSITDAVGRQSPSSDTMFYHLKTTRQRLEDAFKKFVERFLHLYWRGMQRDVPYLLIDETHEPYFGKKRGYWIHKYKAEKGSTGAFRFLVFALTGPTKRLIVNVVPLRRKESRVPYIVETIRWLRQNHIRIRLVLMDRGYYDARIVSALKKLNVKYIIRARICKKMKCMLESITNWTSITYEIGNTGVLTTLVLGRDNHGDWAFATNAQPKQIWRLRHYYRERWNIENIFKLCDGIRLPTNSTRIATKLLCVMISCVIYNTWQHSQERSHGYTLRQATRELIHLPHSNTTNKDPPPHNKKTTE